jgi:Pro-kumamolisin, activation domain
MGENKENSNNEADRRQRLPGSERPRPASHKHIGSAPADELVSATLVVRRRSGSPPLPDLEHWQKTPPGRRKFLSTTEYAAFYGADQQDLDAVAAFAHAHGLSVLRAHAGRRTVEVQGTVAQMNAAFGVVLNHYEDRSSPGSTLAALGHPGIPTHRGFDGPIQLPPELSGIVVAVVGLDNRFLGTHRGALGDPSGAGYQPVPTIAQQYNIPNSGASGQTIGIIAPQPQSAPATVPSYLPSDITSSYFPSLAAGYQTAPASINNVNLTVGSQTYQNNQSQVTSITSVSTANNAILELTQDISTAATIAQGATVNVYFTEASEQGFLVFLNRVLLPESESQPTVLSFSFGIYLGDDSSYIGKLSDSGSAVSLMTELFQQLAAIGVNVFIALGDWGADNWYLEAAPNSVPPDGKIHVSYPGTDPWVTACGGTLLGSTQETAWSDAFSTTSQFGGSFNGNQTNSNFGSTAGGVSATFAAPPYQTAAGITGAKDSAGTFHTGRGVPDVSGNVAFSGFFVNGLSYSYVGTSCVAPFYAGFAAVLRAAFGVALGPLNSLLYQLQNTAFNDITAGNNDSHDTPSNVKIAIPSYSGSTPDAPFFSAGAGWDACTGLGSADGTKLLNGIASLLYNPNCYFQVNKGNYGLDEVTTNPTYSDTIALVLEGFTPQAVTAAGLAPTVNASLSGVTVSVGPPQFELASETSTPQRTLFYCTVSFTPSDVKTVSAGGIFPDPGAASPTPVNLTSSILIGGQIFSPFTQIELEAGDDPYFSNFDPTFSNPFYLSQDLRVFTVTPGINPNPIDGVVSLAPADNTSFDTSAGYAYIQQLLTHLNSKYSDPTQTDPFTLFPDQTSALSGDSSVTPTTINPADPTGTPFANYNFAVAKVRLSGSPGSSGANVRVLFRLFASQTGDTDFQSSTYPSTLDGAGQPLAPQMGTDNVTIPFFATGNFQKNGDFQANVDYSANSVNNQPVNIGSGGSVWAYYGCYLNIYPPKNTINGHAVQSLLPSAHSCVVAQISYDNAPMPTGPGVVQGPEYSDNFAQRNLQITFSDNPGPAATHTVPQTFDARPSPAPSGGGLLNYPDELMIDWGNIPVGATASVYWPQVAASDVLALAKQFYSTHQLSGADSNTIQCTVPRGFTYIPIPSGAGQNFAGLFTVGLPAGTKAGQVFTIVVRRVSSYRGPAAPPPPPPPPQIQGRSQAVVVTERENRNWRYVVGTFAVRIPVTTAKVMLPAEENTLAIMKWRLDQMSPSNRWYPVLQRYIGLVVARINGLGGNAGSIIPSPWGVYSPPQLPVVETAEYSGKIAGLTYNGFGDFEGFLLETTDCQIRRVCSRETKVESIVHRAWLDRSPLIVVVQGRERCCLVSIILGAANPKCRCD